MRFLAPQLPVGIRAFDSPVTFAMRLTLAVPDLLEIDHDVLAAMPVLRTLAACAGNANVVPGGLAAALLASWRADASFGTAPLAALGAGFDPGDTYVLRADPVALVAGRSDVTLANRIDDLGPADAGAIMALLNGHFAGDGLVFHVPRPDAWFVTTRHRPVMTTTPVAAVRGAIFRHLPQGDDATRWRRWMSEMQMLLHDHPVNLAREARGLLPVTGIWPAEGGSLADVPRGPRVAVYAAGAAAADVARGIALRGGGSLESVPASFAALQLQEDTIVVLDAVPDANATETVMQNWIDPALTTLQRGDLETLRVVADGQGIAATWHAVRRPLGARIRARFSPPVFALPSPPEYDA
jgi:hypothetical protein